MTQKIKNLTKIIFASIMSFAPLNVLAQRTGIDAGLNKIKDSFPDSGGLASQNASVSSVLLWVINILLILSGIVAVLFIIIGGFWYITSAGDSEQAEKGKTTLVNAIIGIVLVVLSFVIINVITNLVGQDRV